MERLTWSRPGHIAFIAKGTVYVTWLQCVDGAEWRLADPIAVAARGTPVAVSWSAGSDFMVIDSFGLIQMFSMTVADGPLVRSLPLVPAEMRDRPAELNTVVCTFWISGERKVAMPVASTIPGNNPINIAGERNGASVSPAQGVAQQQQQQQQQQQGVTPNSVSGDPGTPRQTSMRPSWEPIRPQGFQHPIQGAAALLAVTRNGLLRLIVELNDRSFREVSIPLEGAEALQAATILPHGSSVLVAVYTALNKVIVYQVQAEFFAPCYLRSAQQQQQQQQQAAEAAAATTQSAGENSAAAKASPAAAAAGPPARLTASPISLMTVSPPENMWLGHFGFIRQPGVRRGLQNVTNDLEIDMVFSGAQTSMRMPLFLREIPQSLHGAFSQVIDTSPSPLAVQLWSCVTGEITAYQKKLTCVTTTRVAVITHFADGEMLQRSLVQPLLLMPNGILDVPLEQLEALGKASCLCLSPNLCVALYLPSETDEEKQGSDILPRVVQFEYSSQGFTPQRRAELATAVATSYAYSVYNTVQADDLLSVVWRILHIQLKDMNIDPSEALAQFTSEAQLVLNVSFEPPDDPRQGDRHVIPSPLQRWLIFQLVLDTGSEWQRNAGAQLAWLALNLQLAVYSIFSTLRSLSVPSRAQTPAQFARELADHATRVSSVLGSIRWTTDVACHISRELYLATVLSPHAAEAATSSASVPLPASASPSDRAAMAAALHLSSHSSSFINLILSKTMRFLLINTLRALKRLDQLTERLAAQEQQIAGQPGAIAAARQRLTSILESPPVALSSFERVLGEIETHLKPLYASGNIPERTRLALELGLLRNARTPRVLLPIVYRLVRLFSAYVVDQTDVPRLYFYNTVWLKIRSCKDGAKGDQVDGIRKRVLAEADPSGTCTRCGLVSMLSSAGSRAQSDWTKYFRQNCLCGGLWQRSQQSLAPPLQQQRVAVAASPAVSTPSVAAPTLAQA